MGKLKERHLDWLLRMPVKKSLVILSVFIISASGQPTDSPVISTTNSTENSSNSSISSTESTVVSETTISPGALSSVCKCASDVPCEKNVTSTDCPNGRIIARPDCSCCFVCAKQLTESCNQSDAPCDSDYGLICGSDQKCQAKSTCSDDTSCSSDLMCLGGACADPCKVLPDVCASMELKGGTCVVRNHRSICSCPPGQSVNAEKQCVPTEHEASHCEKDGLTYKIGSKFYKETCAKLCRCESSGNITCEGVSDKPSCEQGTIPLTQLGGEMTHACKLLIGHGNNFDGCCVPEKCGNLTVAHDDINLQGEEEDGGKGPRDFKITKSPNQLDTNDDSKVTKDLISKDSSTDQVMILQRTDHSAVIELPKSDAEAILSIALTSEHNKDPANDQVWKEHRIPQGLPQITLSDLIPSTSYTLKYSVNGKSSPAVQFITNDIKSSTPSEPVLSSSRGGLGTATGRSMKIEEVTPTGTGVIADSTEASASFEAGSTVMSPTSGEAVSAEIMDSGSYESPEMTSISGCTYNGSEYQLGHELFNGCDEKCTCMANGEMKCVERCLIPMFKKGAMAHDKMCTEEPVDECCVIVACARGTHSSTSETRDLIAFHPEPCDSVKCGKNAGCIGPSGMLGEDENQTNQTLCLCNDGFTGDPYDELHGCQESVSPSPPVEGSSPPSPVVLDSGVSSTSKPDGCIFNNQTFQFGDEHLDGCNYKCRCENSGELTCLPRCNYRRDDENEIPMGCEIQKDPSDNCCEMLVCHGKPLESGSRKDDSTVLNDGCVYKNKSYKKDEKFYDGCESQCMCISNSDVTCQPRCPPGGPHSGESNCVTLEDPVDKCCKVTICGNQTLYDEVMKAEAAKMTHDPTELPVPPATGMSRSMTSSEEAAVAELHQEHHPEDSLASSEMPPTAASHREIDIRIGMVKPLNNTAIQVGVAIPENELATLVDENLVVRYSHDLSEWKELVTPIKKLFIEGAEELNVVVGGLSPGQQYYFKALVNKFESNVASGLTKMLASHHELAPLSEETGSSMESGELHDMVDGDTSGSEETGQPCPYKGKMYKPLEEFYDECEAYCMCDGKGNVTCVEIDCPKDGRELIDESCVRWEPDMRDFRKEAPFCCPDIVCVQHSHCELEDGYILQNFEEIPPKLTNCESTCQCLFGNITCHPGNNCPHVSDHPPAGLACSPELTRKVPMIENECCFQWACINMTADGSKAVDGLNNSLTSHPHSHHNAHDIYTQTNMTLDPPSPPGAPDHSLLDDDENEHEPDYDQFLPHQNHPLRPPGGGAHRPNSHDRNTPLDLQEILHHLLGGGGPPPLRGHPQQSQPPQPPPQHQLIPGEYTTVGSPQEVAALEQQAGGRYIGRAEDGSYIVAVPQPPRQNHFAGPGGLQRPRPPLPNQQQQRPILHAHSPNAQSPFSGHFPPPPSPFGLPHHPGQLGGDATKVSNIIIQPLNESTLQIDFTVSPILVGLQGHVEVLYTKDYAHKPNPAQWESKVFQQAEDLIDNTHLQLFLTNLEPDTDYYLQIKVAVMAQFQPTSDIHRVHTPAPTSPPTTLPPEIAIDPELQLETSGSRSVKLRWRKLEEYDNLVDGVQIAYKESQDLVYSTTPLIHRSVTEYSLTGLKPNKDYEVNLLFIPFHTDQKTLLKSEKPIFIKTDQEEDEYNFDLALSPGKVTMSSVELRVAGVPPPEDKFVNIYQVFYSVENEKEEQKSYFKVPKSETSKRATLTDLRPGTKYTIWLEAFLSNGKKKRSNVIDVTTKAGELPAPEKSEQETQESKPQLPQTSSYYGALVALAIVAAMSILGIIALLMILIKKQNQAKAPINDRKSESSYDNPSFKSFDIESNGHLKPGEL